MNRQPSNEIKIKHPLATLSSSTFFELRLDDSNQDWLTMSLTKKIDQVLYIIRSST